MLPPLPEHPFRPADHGFEWTRSELQACALGIEQRYGYRAALSCIDAGHPELGSATQLAVFSR